MDLCLPVQLSICTAPCAQMRVCAAPAQSWLYHSCLVRQGFDSVQCACSHMHGGGRGSVFACAAEYLHCTSCADQHLCCTCAVLFSVQIAALLQLTSVILQLLGPPRFRQCQPRLLSPALAATLMLCLPQAAASSWIACSPQSAQSPLGPCLTPMEWFV